MHSFSCLRTGGSGSAALVVVLALLGITAPVSGQVALAAPVDDAARLAAVERENATLRKEIAALRERDKLKAEKAKIERRVESPPPPLAESPAAAVYAADLPVKAPPPAAAYNWTGCYVGANGGGVWGRSNVSSTVTSTIPFNVPFINELLSEQSPSLHPSGFTGGGQVGCNWQSNRFVWGLDPISIIWA